MQKINFNKLCNIFYIITLFAIVCFGLYLRIRSFLYNNPAWWDEIVLCLNIINSHSFIDLFKPLEYLQVAPPLYLCLIKIITHFFGTSIYTFRIYSLFTGSMILILSVPLLRKIFKNPFSILFSLFLIAVNIPLIYYSREFKPYINDVFILVILVLIYDKINLLKKIHLFLFSILCIVLPFFSFTSLICLASIIILMFFKLKGLNKLKILLPSLVLISSVFLLWVIERGQYPGMLNCDEWSYSFIAPNFDSFISINRNFLEYIFIPFKFEGYSNSFIPFLIFVCGIISAFLNKDKIQIKTLLLLFIILTYFASVIHIYPFKGRPILFLIPVFIIFVSANFQNKDIKDFIKSSLIALIFLYSINFQNNYFLLFNRNYNYIGGMYEERVNSKEEVFALLNNYINSEKIISTFEFYVLALYYNKINNYNIKMNNSIHVKNINDFKKEIIKNKNENLWILGFIHYPNYDENIDYYFKEIEITLIKQNMRYEIIKTKKFKIFHTNVS